MSSKQIESELLNELNAILDKPEKSIYKASILLAEKMPDIILFKYISILSYNKGKKILKNLNFLNTIHFYVDINDFKLKVFQFFINILKDKDYENDKKVIEEVSELIKLIPLKAKVNKYFDMIAPLTKEKEQKTQLKYKLFVMTPNIYEHFYNEVSIYFPTFPKDAVDFYSHAQINSNADKIKKFVEEKKMNQYQQIQTNTNEIAFLKEKIAQLAQLEKDSKAKMAQLEKDSKAKIAQLEKDSKILNNRIDSLQYSLYQINLRDTIKSFIDELMDCLDIFNSNATHSMKLKEIKNKIKSLSNGFNNEDKKMADLLLVVLNHLVELNKNGDDLSHFFNNIGFNKDNLPEKIKKKFIDFSQNDDNYDYVILTAISMDEYIDENQQKVLIQFVKDIKSKHVKNAEENKKIIINSLKLHSRML